MKNILIISVLLFFIAFKAKAQDKVYTLDELLPATTKSRNLIVIQNPKLNAFLQRERNYNAKHKSMPGWRIQIYFATGRGAKEGAENVRASFMNEHPETKAYINYFAPYFKVYVGNFRSKREAANLRLQIKDKYKEAWLVKDKIEWPEI